MNDTDIRLADWGDALRSSAGAPPPLDDLRRRASHRRTRRRGLIAGCACLVLALALVGTLVAVDRHDDGSIGVVSVTTTTEVPSDVPIAESIEDVVAGGIGILHQPNLQAGGPIQIAADPAVAGDAAGDPPRLCFDWGAATTCDPSAWQLADGPVMTGERIWWNRAVPGWVVTPGGLRTCAEVRCVVLLTGSDGTPHVSPPIDVAPGPRPRPVAAIEGIGADGSMDVRLASAEPDPSWTTWAAGASPEQIAGLPAFGIARCAAVDVRWRCDALHDEPAVPTGDGPVTLELPAGRDLFTNLRPDPWVDSAEVACAIAISRTTGVAASTDGSVGAGDELIAWLPYRVPATARRTTRPTVTVDPDRPWRVGQEVTVTVDHEGIDADDLTVQQCWLGDVLHYDCAGAVSFLRPIGGHRARASFEIVPCPDPDGCVISIKGPGDLGYPGIARTTPFRPAT